MKRRAFTLIELLVVIAIIAILAAMLFPVFAQGRSTARKTLALSNMKQIALAATMYADDHDETYPRTMALDPANPTVPLTVSWQAVHNYQELLNPYIRMGRGTTNKGSVWWDPSDPERSARFMWGSFTHNGMLTGVVRRKSEVAKTSETVFATLRADRWEAATGVKAPSGNPGANDPFWASVYFDMCVDPWELQGNQASPFHWSKGMALPPCSLYPTASPCGQWDIALDPTRYNNGTLLSYADGHAKWGYFSRTFRTPTDNDWDIH